MRPSSIFYLYETTYTLNCPLLMGLLLPCPHGFCHNCVLHFTADRLRVRLRIMFRRRIMALSVSLTQIHASVRCMLFPAASRHQSAALGVYSRHACARERSCRGRGSKSEGSQEGGEGKGPWLYLPRLLLLPFRACLPTFIAVVLDSCLLTHSRNAVKFA